MNNLKLIFIVGLLCCFFQTKLAECRSTIRIFCTAALISDHYAQRQEQYTKSLQCLKRFGYDTYLVESCATGPTFLDTVCKNVCYTQTNNSSLKNKGINEIVSMITGLKYFNFDSEDMIVKITGRYPLDNDELIQLVINNPDAEAVVRVWPNSIDDVYTGFYAMKAKYLFDFFANLDLEKMERNNTPIEWEVGKYIAKMKKQGLKIVYIPRIPDYLPVCVPWR